jgi:uncharacterized membrane protein
MKNWRKYLATGTVIGILVLAVTGSVILARAHEEGPWIDSTDAVSAQSASAAGRQAADPLINTDQGNMLVFFFTLAGVMAGSVIGYYWRKLIIGKEKEGKEQTNKLFLIGVSLAVALLIISGHERIFYWIPVGTI